VLRVNLAYGVYLVCLEIKEYKANKVLKVLLDLLDPKVSWVIPVTEDKLVHKVHLALLVMMVCLALLVQKVILATSALKVYKVKPVCPVPKENRVNLER
jgi:hypothetical protein